MDEFSNIFKNMSSRSDKIGNMFSLGAGMASPVFGMASDFIMKSMTDDYNREVAEKAERRQREAEREAYARAAHQQRIADAYNTPSAIMARMREAGLNPLMAFNNGMSGNLSTGVPSAVTPQSMGVPQSQPVDTELFSAFMQMNDQLLKQRELEITANKYEFENAKTDAERAGILKTNSYMDAVENDRHAEANSRILTNAAQRELYFAQKFKAIDDCIDASRRFFEDKRQFDVKMKYLKDKDMYDNSAREYEREQNWLMQEREMALRERMEDATNETWMKATLSNNDYSKFSFYMDNEESPWKRIAQYEGIQLGRRGLGEAASALGEMAGSKGVLRLVKRAKHIKERIDKLQKNRSDKRDAQHSDKAEEYYRKYEESLKKGDTKAADDYLNRAFQEINDIKSSDFIFK